VGTTRPHTHSTRIAEKSHMAGFKG